MTTAQYGGKVVSLTNRPPLPPGNASGTQFCWRLSRPQGHSAIGRIMSMKNSNDTICNRTSDLPSCSQYLNHCATISGHIYEGRLAPKNQNNSENNSIPLRHHSEINTPAQKNANFNIYYGSIKICVLLCWCVGFRVMAKWDTLVFRIVLVLGS
jgi:hypothetical protein